MSSHDALPSEERLATVSYLFGAGAGVEPPTGPPTEPRAEPDPELRARPRVGFSVETFAAAAAPDSAVRSSARAEKVSMKGLTRRNLSRWELEQLLRGRELDENTVIAELNRLEGVGLIDDAALAETLVRTQHERKGLGRSVIAADLRRRHIDQQHIDHALSSLGEDDEQSRATELAVKRAGQLRSYDRETATRRLSAFLMRKGYSSAVVRGAVTEAMSGRAAGAGAHTVSFR